MQTHQGPTIDLSDLAHRVIKDLDGRELFDALLRLTTIVRPPSCEETRKRAIELAKEFPLGHLFGKQTVNAKGRVVSRTPGVRLEDLPTDNEAVLASMYEQQEASRDILVKGMIEPGRKKILYDHNVTEAELLRLVTHHPIVPPGHERQFARALHSGLVGDFIQSAHVGVPQIEHAIRTLLNRRGVITTTLTTDGIQDESSLNTLLDKPELVEILGEDLVFDMRSLLAERDGANLRNLVAHGLLADEHLGSAQVIYAWWLILHLCFLPFVARIAAIQVATADPPTDD